MRNRWKNSLSEIEAAKKTPLPWARGERRAAMIARRALEETAKPKPLRSAGRLSA